MDRSLSLPAPLTLSRQVGEGIRKLARGRDTILEHATGRIDHRPRTRPDGMSAVDHHVSKFLEGKRVLFAGKLGGLTKREAQQLVRQNGGSICEPGAAADDADLIVIGADELPLGEDELLTDAARDAVAEGKLEVLSETQFWQRLGLVETEQSVRRLYTPAMLAELLHLPVATIRRWHRRGLIIPVREVHRLPYFDFQEVATARRLAQLLAAGASPAAIERKLEELARLVPDVERPLSQLSVIVEGKQLLLRQGEGLIEPGGQRRIDFEALASDADPDACRSTIAMPHSNRAESDESGYLDPEEMLALAAELEDEGRLTEAAEFCRASLAATGPKPEVCFQLAELLYRLGEVQAARERYFMAVELDEDYVEARANLGCVLAETGQLHLAVAAFQGALVYHEDYPDVHYHLARALDELGQFETATSHWQRFLALSPDSPWADEARQRLSDEGAL